MLDRYNLGNASVIILCAIFSRLQQIRFGELSEVDKGMLGLSLSSLEAEEGFTGMVDLVAIGALFVLWLGPHVAFVSLACKRARNPRTFDSNMNDPKNSTHAPPAASNGPVPPNSICRRRRVASLLLVAALLLLVRVVTASCMLSSRQVLCVVLPAVLVDSTIIPELRVERPPMSPSGRMRAWRSALHFANSSSALPLPTRGRLSRRSRISKSEHVPHKRSDRENSSSVTCEA